MKTDLVMWTKNGEATLNQVLRQIDRVMPRECINQKIVVDDRSIDRTKKIAEKFGWTVVYNEGRGISDGANTALKHVEAPLLCSFEQDIILSPDWAVRVPLLLTGKTAIASGLRCVSSPAGLNSLQRYVAAKYLSCLPSWLGGRELNAFTFGKTLDNTVYNVEVLREVGGFPLRGRSYGVDTALALRIKKAGYDWAICPDVWSLHLRGGLLDELRHQKTYGVAYPGRASRLVVNCAASPFAGVFAAWKAGDPRVAVYYPLLKLAYLKGKLAV